MRDILFRGKPCEQFRDFPILRKEYCEEGFVYGSLIIAAENMNYICVGGFCSSRSIINNGVTTMVEVVPETVGQHTGLTDKNGKKIFEGDIVKGYNSLHEDRLVYRVVYETNGFYYMDEDDVTWHPDNIEKVEVIGNIRDNPELMEED